jgi:eukaryotic-like serine/threonine-protein kinase
MPLAVGDKLGHYEVVALIGQGGMGELYRVGDTELKRDVALQGSAVQREAEVLASLGHPNVGPIYEVLR